jgi:hypothetical protein
LVYDASKVANLLDAYKLAKSLGFVVGGSDSHCRLRYYKNECLVWGGISGDNYALLAILPATDSWETMIQLKGLNIALLKAFMEQADNDIEAALEPQMYIHTGAASEIDLDCLIRALRA